MAEYIDREYVLKCMEDSYKNAGISAEAKAKMTRWLNKAPAADVRPVVRGKWKPRDLTYGRNYYFCSACEETVDMPTAMGIPMFRYCPNCGATMKEKIS